MAILDISKALSRKRCKIGSKLSFFNRKSHVSFRLVPTSVTLNDLEQHNSRYVASFSVNSIAFRAHCVKVVEDIPKFSTTEM